MSKTQSSESYSLLKFNPTSENPTLFHFHGRQGTKYHKELDSKLILEGS
jgi:hypothetical protein